MEGVNKFLILAVILILSVLGWKFYEDWEGRKKISKEVEFVQSGETIKTLGTEVEKSKKATKLILERSEKSEKLQKESSETTDRELHEKNFWERL